MFDFGRRFAGLREVNVVTTDSCRRCNMHHVVHLKMRIRGRLFLDLRSGWSRTSFSSRVPQTGVSDLFEDSEGK